MTTPIRRALASTAKATDGGAGVRGRGGRGRHVRATLGSRRRCARQGVAGRTRPYNASSADMALANQLARWTGKDVTAWSALCAGRPWRARMGARTAPTGRHDRQAAAFIRVLCRTSRPPRPRRSRSPRCEAGGRTLRDTSREYLSADDQLEHFDGCFYLVAQDRHCTTCAPTPSSSAAHST